MAIQNAIDGKQTGKIGGKVYSVVNGQQVVREYRANIANPNTELQVQSRAKLKLMSQLAAVVAPIIAIKREGMKSGRNIFISRNYEFAGFENDEATINLNQVQLTKGTLSIGSFSANREDGVSLTCILDEDMSNEIDRVVYVAITKEEDGSLHLHDSKTITIAGDNGRFPADLRYTDKSVVIYAYGVRENTDKAKAKFASIKAPNAEQVAKLLTSRSLSTADYTMTNTAGVTLQAGEQGGSVDDETRVTISVIKTGAGNVSGAGSYLQGAQVTLVATPLQGGSFLGWREGSAAGTLLSAETRYQFEATENKTIYAVFENAIGGQFTINATSNDNTKGTVSGGGQFSEGESCTLVARPISPAVFDAWYENNESVSSNPSYTFTVEGNRDLVAHFHDDDPEN